VKKKLEEWKKFKEVQAAEEIHRKQGNSKAMGVLQRQLAGAEEGLKMSSYCAWRDCVKEEIKQRLHKDKAMKSAMKTIANEGMGLLSNCFHPWKKETEHQKRHLMEIANQKMIEANARSGGSAEAARKKALAQLEKQFIGQDKALVKEAFGAWASGAALRKKKEGNMHKGARMIANSGKALCAEVFTSWNVEAENTRKKKKDKEASNHKAARMIAGSGKALQADVFNTWHVWVQGEANERKLKAAGNTKAAKMMANSEGTLKNLIFDSWAKLQAERRTKDQGNKKAARMIAGSAQAILVAVVKEWGSICVTKKAKESGNAKAGRMIASSGEALMAICFVSWRDDIRKNREKNKKMRAVEKTLGASAEGLKLIVTTSWRNNTIMELRKSRAKGRSMASSMKTINGNQDLLMTQITMSWARVIAAGIAEKLKEKVTLAQGALDEAMAAATKAVEEDLGKCQEEVDRLRAELEAAQKNLANALAKSQDLEGQIQESDAMVVDREQQLNSLVNELEDSRRKAKDIGDELAKVGIFLQGTKKKNRPPSGTRSNSGGKDEGLPKIGTGGRPMSARKS